MLNPDLDIEALKERFAADDRVRIDQVLEDRFARAVAREIRDLPFDTILFSGGSNHVVSPETMAGLQPDQRRALQQELMELASRGIGFLYEGYRMEGEHLDQAPPAVRQLFHLVNSPEMVHLVTTVSGMELPGGASGQYTRYRPGHYLTRHSDDIRVEGRRLAYVLNFSEDWHPDWGGLLQFYEKSGVPRDAWEPRFNSMSLFEVRHIHAVTYVAPHAAAPRLALTGWYRG